MDFGTLKKMVAVAESKGISNSDPVMFAASDTFIYTIKDMTTEHHEDGIGSTVWLKGEEY